MKRIIENTNYILRGEEAREIYEEIKDDPIFDVHTHVVWASPVAGSAWDILKYHYFTEMAYTQGFPKKVLFDTTLSLRERTKEIVGYLPGMRTTAPYWWLIALSQKLFDFEHNFIGPENWEEFFQKVEEKSQGHNWLGEVKKLSNIERICLTNLPWEKLEGMDRDLFLPTFRVDPLLNIENREFELIKNQSNMINLSGYEEYIAERFDYFVKHGARSAAVSLPPNFPTMKIERTELFDEMIKHPVRYRNNPDEMNRFKAYIMNYIANLCEVNNMPFQLMVGVRKEIYEHGVPGGCDQSDPVSSLGSLLYLLNGFPDINFPISILSSTQSQELAEYARDFRNVYASGHWWFTNTVKGIEDSLNIRLELSPYTKHLGFYSDAYTMELIWAKTDTYRRIESNVFAEKYVYQGKLNIDDVVEIIRIRDYKTPKKLMRIK